MPATATVMKTVAVAGHDLFNRHGSVRSVSHQWTGQDMMAGRLCTGEIGRDIWMGKTLII